MAKSVPMLVYVMEPFNRRRWMLVPARAARCCLLLLQKLQTTCARQHLFLFDYWADTILHALLPKSFMSMAHRYLGQSRPRSAWRSRPWPRRTNQAAASNPDSASPENIEPQRRTDSSSFPGVNKLDRFADKNNRNFCWNDLAFTVTSLRRAWNREKAATAR